MTALTNTQSKAIRAYLTTWNKYKDVAAIQAGAAVDEAAWEISHEAAAAVATAFGVKSSGPTEALLELLCGVKVPPCDVPSVAAVVRELAEADTSGES